MSTRAKALRTLIGAPELDNLYSLNEEPVVTRWGLPPPAAPASLLSAALAPPPSLTKTTHRRWGLRIPFWLLLMPLLLLLLWLLWTWRGGVWHWLHPVPVGNYACSAGAPVPDFAVVLDTSGSMIAGQRGKHQR